MACAAGEQRRSPVASVCGCLRGRVLGPGGDEPIRELPTQALIDTLNEVRTMPRRQAAATLADVLERRDRTGIPGVMVRGLLTKHVLSRRLRRDHPEDWQRLTEAADKVRADRDWRQNLTALGYKTEELKERSHLLRFEEGGQKRQEGRAMDAIRERRNPAHARSAGRSRTITS